MFMRLLIRMTIGAMLLLVPAAYAFEPLKELPKQGEPTIEMLRSDACARAAASAELPPQLRADSLLPGDLELCSASGPYCEAALEYVRKKNLHVDGLTCSAKPTTSPKK